MSVHPIVVSPLRAVVVLLALLLPGLSLVPPAVATTDHSRPAAAASAGQIVYACGADLCTVDPATGRSAKLTDDGAGYYRPSISLDGSRIAAARGAGIVAGPYGSRLNENWAADVEGLNDLAISPDGQAVAASHWYTKLEMVYDYVCGGMCLKLVHYNGAEFWPRGGSTPAHHTGSSGVGFLGSALLSTDYTLGDYNPDTGRYEGSMEQICVVSSPADDAATCDVRVNEPADDAATGRRVNLSDPTGSPDGTMIAAVVGLYPAADGAIVDNPTGESPVIKVYDATSGALVTRIPGNGSSPSFSPDSSQLTFQGTDGFVYVVGARGGTPRRLVEGRTPSWGGVSGKTPPPPTRPPGAAGVGTIKVGKRPLKVTRRTVRLTIACPARVTAGCRGTARIRVGKQPITTKRSYRIKPGKKASVKLTVTKKGMRTIKRRPTPATAELFAPSRKKPSAKKKIKLRH